MEQKLRYGWEAGCSALSWDTRDGCRLWGRNYDFDRLAEGSQVTFLPRNNHYTTLVTTPEEPPAPEVQCTGRYASMGMGLLLRPTPVLYEGLNERGLMGGQLYYRAFAHYPEQCRAGTQAIQPPFLVYHLLSQCATVEEVVCYLEQDATLVSVPMLGTVPPLHWAFRDCTGETIIIEPDRDGLHIYRNTLGVMTNSPSYPWHQQNLLNYAGIRDLDYAGLDVAGIHLEQCFSGSGVQGLPGDWSSPSRFVRLAFLKHYAVPGDHEAQGVSRMLHLMQSAAFPLGMVRVSHQSPVTDLDKQVEPYDYTVYTTISCAQSLRFYWTTYENQRVQYAELGALLHCQKPFQIPLEPTPDFRCVTPTQI